MRRRVHRDSHAPRVEMTPLLDVIFLLLTFFIYSFVLTVRAQVLPVALPALSTGQVPTASAIVGVTVDRAGHFFLNQKPVSFAQLERRLRELIDRADAPAVFLALDTGPGEVDRGPIFIRVIDLFRRVGIDNFHIVGREEKTPVAP